MSEETTREAGFGTKAVRGGYSAGENNAAVVPPIYQTTAFELASPEEARDLFGARKLGYIYSRPMNPTTTALEERIRQLEGASGVVSAPSGMAAIAYTLLALTEGGGSVLASPFLYGGMIDSFHKLYPKFGIRVDLARHILEPDLLEQEIRPDTRAIYVESISNPNAYLVDVDALAEVAHRHHIPLVVDNTVATPYLYRPLEHGADVVVYSLTKGLSGHGNIIGGLVLESGKFGYSRDLYPQIYEGHYTLRDLDGNPQSFIDVFPQAPLTTLIRMVYVTLLGSVLQPFDSYLALQGVETLPLRLAQESASALKLAQWLEGNPHVAWVRYPGLESSPFHQRAQRDLPRGAGALLSFGFDGTPEQEDKFLNALHVFSYLANIGDVRSLIIDSPNTTHSEAYPSEWDLADLPRNLVRISVGLEDVDDLIADLDTGFAAAFGGAEDEESPEPVRAVA
jgi:O-acetylhomoserine (thiol)-lyase